jgi:hypothetical protein
VTRPCYRRLRRQHGRAIPGERGPREETRSPTLFVYDAPAHASVTSTAPAPVSHRLLVTFQLSMTFGMIGLAGSVTGWGLIMPDGRRINLSRGRLGSTPKQHTLQAGHHKRFRITFGMAFHAVPDDVVAYNAQHDVALHAYVTLGTGETVETTEPLRLPKGSLSPT